MNGIGKNSVLGLALAFVLILVLVVSGLAGDFTSFRGKFHIAYPEGWSQVDYQTANYYMKQTGSAAEFEVILSAETEATVFEGIYMILTFEPTGELDQQQIDSVVEVVTNSFDRKLLNISPDAFITELHTNNIVYDSGNSRLAVTTKLVEDNNLVRMNMLAMQFFDQGIANFYFYSPDSLFEGHLEDFKSIVNSFATGAAVKKSSEPVKVANLKDDDDSGVPVAVWVGAAVAIGAAIITNRKRSRKKKANS